MDSPGIDAILTGLQESLEQLRAQFEALASKVERHFDEDRTALRNIADNLGVLANQSSVLLAKEAQRLARAEARIELLAERVERLEGE